MPEDPDDGWWYDDETGEWYEVEPERGLLWVLAWTVLGTLLPGVGLLRAGRRALGLMAFVIAVLAAAFAGYSRNDLTRLLDAGLDPQLLLGAAVLVGAVGVFLLVVLIGTNLALMRYTGGGVWTRAGNRTALVLLAGGVAIPAYATVINLLLTRASLLAALEANPYS